MILNAAGPSTAGSSARLEPRWIRTCELSKPTGNLQLEALPAVLVAGAGGEDLAVNERVALAPDEAHLDR